MLRNRMYVPVGVAASMVRTELLGAAVRFNQTYMIDDTVVVDRS